MKSAFGISAGQTSSHWPQFTQESAMWAYRIRWNMKLTGNSPGGDIRRVLGRAVHAVADRALVDALVALDAAGGLAHDLL